MLTNQKVALVIPTIREESIVRFFDEWNDIFNTFSENNTLSIILVVDFENVPFSIPEDANRKYDISYFCWADIDKELGDDSWIIPRRTDCIRSFGYLKAYQLSPHYIFTLDDDCYPEHTNGFFEGHIANLETVLKNKWVYSLPGIETRGVPYVNTVQTEFVMLSHGLWKNVVDHDAPTSLCLIRNPDLHQFEGMLPSNHGLIPIGKYFPMCGMNLAWRAEITPIMYFLLMGKGEEYDRFGDIWCGIIAKKILDHLSLRVYNGGPDIFHDRASNVFDNLVKEAAGIRTNEDFWAKVDQIQLTGSTLNECYKELAENIDLEGPYWDRLRKAMKIWVNLF